MQKLLCSVRVGWNNFWLSQPTSEILCQLWTEKSTDKYYEREFVVQF